MTPADSSSQPSAAGDALRVAVATDAQVVEVVVDVDMRQAVLDFVERTGLRVIPLFTPDECRAGRCPKGAKCKNEGKHPRIKKWESAASADAAQIEQWWELWPGSNVGMPLGINGLLGADVDDPARFTELEAEFGPMPPTIEQSSGRGGGARHLIYASDEPLRSLDAVFGKGFDVKCHGGQIVMPPSLHKSGRRYAAHSERTFGLCEATPISEWRGYARLREKLLPRKRSVAAPAALTPTAPARDVRSDAHAPHATRAAAPGKPDPLEVLADTHFALVNQLTPVAELREALVGFAAATGDLDALSRAQAKRVARARLRGARIADCAELVKLAFAGATRHARSSDAADWESRLTRTTNGRHAATTANILSILRYEGAWDAALGFDARSGRTTWLSPPPWRRSERESWTQAELRDSDYPRVAGWLETSRFGIIVGPSSDALRGAIAVAAEDRRFDRVVDYLDARNWDGIARLDNLLPRYFGALVDDDVRDDDKSKQREYLAAVGPRSLISGVARAYEPGCKADHVLVLVGPQGVGKSSAIRVLAGAENFADSLPDLGHKDAADYLRGVWVVELSELDSISRSELATVKAFVSRTCDRYRAAYGRATEAHPRRCIFIGSTNEDAFLSDVTGNRRFWPVTVGRVDLEALRRDRDQLWAEAVVRYRAGEPWHLDSERLVKAAVSAQEGRQIVDAWQPAIAAFVARYERVAVQEVLRSCLGLELERWGQIEQNRVARVLRQLGWTLHQVRDGERRVRVYVAPTKVDR